jgi:glycosyltransferase involved in cell wall biosynthesis
LNNILVLCDGWAGISSPLNNLVRVLSKQSKIDVFYHKKPFEQYEFEIPHFNFENVNLIIVESKLTKENIFQKAYRKLLSVNQFEYNFSKSFEIDVYDEIIIFDKVLRIVGHKFFFNSKKFTFFSLEIPNIIRRRDKLFLRSAERIFTQDLQRGEILSKYYRVSLDRIRVVYNSSIGTAEIKHTDYFYKMFKIDPTLKILLMTGTISFEHGLRDFLLIVDKYVGDLIFIIHGWVTDEKIREEIINHSKFKSKLFLSEQIVKFDQKQMLLASASIGFVNFSSDEINYKYGAGSAGKLFDFMQIGKPILANSIPGMYQLVEKNEIGKVYYGLDRIQENIDYLIQNYENLSNNAIQKFPKFEFEKSIQNAFK